LGLNQPAPAPRRTNPLSIDPHTAPSSGNLDYLLEDEGEPKRGGAWKLVLIVIALALAAGFGYLRWKGQGLPGLRAGANKPSAVARNEGASGASSAAPSADSTATSPEVVANQSAPKLSGTTDSAPTPAVPTAATTASNPAVSGTQPSPEPNAGVSGSGDAASAEARPPVTKDTASAANSTAASAARPNPASAQPSARPRAATPFRAADPVAEAQKYIYGKRVPQNCERGLRLLKPAADQANPKAMIEMGALYSAGLCAPRDLPTAYRWFALALRKDPNNLSVQADLKKLWGEMTQPERQLAIRLSQ
jgi:hypothetical protein